MSLPDLRNFPARPMLYTLFQRAVRGSGESLYVSRHVRPWKGARILDVGCATGDILRHMPEVEYIGFDMDERLIQAARYMHGARGKFLRRRLGSDSVEEFEPFDLILATGVLHHLTDEEALEFFHLAARSLKPSGRVVTLDGCYVQGQSRLARFILSRDRGKYVRKANEYVELASRVFRTVRPTVYDRLLRIPSSIIVLECAGLGPEVAIP